MSTDDIKKLTPLERAYYLEFIESDAERVREQIEKAQSKRQK